MTNQNDFLDAGYEIPKGPSNYMKIEQGDNRLRILSKPLVGWEYFNTENKPVRLEGVQEPVVDKKLILLDKYGKQSIKHFWALTVWNYAAKQIQVLTITQSSIQGRIKELAQNADWGNPFGYDITIAKSGTGKETEYSVTPIPPKPLSDEAKAAYKAKPCNLKALLVSGDPFEGSADSAPAKAPVAVPKVAAAAEEIDPLPF